MQKTNVKEKMTIQIMPPRLTKTMRFYPEKSSFQKYAFPFNKYLQ